MTSFDDWPRLTWSFGCTGSRDPLTPPSISIARLETTSLAFMFVEVPEPVWKMSTTNWSSKSPSATSRAAATIASDCSAVERAELVVHLRRRELDGRYRLDERSIEAQIAYREVQPSAHRVRAVVGVYRHVELAHRIAFGPESFWLCQFCLLTGCS